MPIDYYKNINKKVMAHVLFVFFVVHSSVLSVHAATFSSIKNIFSRGCLDLFATARDLYDKRPFSQKNVAYFASSVKLPHLHEVPLSDLNPQFINNINTDLFTVVGAYRGLHGGHRLLLETKRFWADMRKNFNVSANDQPVGDMVLDLRLFPYLIGSEAAFYFGYQIIDEQHLTLPTAQEIQGAIHHFNHGLSPHHSEYIQTNFYPSDQAIESDDDFLQNFLQYGEKPISQISRSFYHDSSAHALEGLFTPSIIHFQVRQVGQIGQRFLQLHSFDLSEETRKRLQYAIVRQIDSLGYIVAAFVPHHLREYFSPRGKGRFNLMFSPFHLHPLDHTFPIWVAPLIPPHYLEVAKTFLQDPVRFYTNVFYKSSVSEKTLLEFFFLKDQQKNPQSYRPLPENLLRGHQRLVDHMNERRNSPTSSLLPLMRKLERNPFSFDFVQRLKRVQILMQDYSPHSSL